MAVFPATTLDQAIDLIIEDGNKFGEVLRGDINTDITVEGGVIPSISKAINVMAAYKSPLDWVEATSETDLLQPRTFTDGVYVPTKTPALMGVTPDPALWKLYLPNSSIQASNVINIPAGDIEATDIQAAINELDAEKLSDAPIDGNDYVRKDAAWVLLPISSFTFDSTQTGILLASTIWQADVSSTTQTRALSASPSDGDEVVVIDAKNNSVINKITIGRNGNTIGGVATDYILDQNQKTVRLRFDLSNTNWEIIGSGSSTFRDGVFATGLADVNPDNGLVHVVTLTGNLTSTFTNVKTGQAVLIVVIPGAFTWTHTNIAKWTNDGAAPSTISAEHWVIVSNVNGTIVGTDLKGVS